MPASVEELRAIQTAIEEMDPERAIVELDVLAHTVSYSAEITQHEDLSAYAGDEEPTRAFIVAWLCTVGGYQPSDLCLEHRYKIGSSNSVELDIRVSRPGSGKAYALIEVKPIEQYRAASEQQIDGQLFTPAAKEDSTQLKILSLASVAVGASGHPSVVATTIPYSPGATFAAWVSAGAQSGDSIPINYGEPTIEAHVPGGSRDLRIDMGRLELETLRRRLHDRLWGGSRDDNQIYAWLTRLFLTKIHDEKQTNDGEPYAFQIRPEGYSAEPPAATAKRIEATFREAYKRYVSPGNSSSLKLGPDGLFPQSELLWVVEELQGISLTAAGQNSGDLLGSFFESITRDGFKQSKGLFFTHYNIAVFMAAAMDLPEMAEAKLKTAAHANDRLPYVIDPSCGSGTFLLAAMRLVTNHISRAREDLSKNRDVAEQLSLRFPSEAPNNWAKDFLYGIEKRDDLTISTKVNMVLHRDGHTHVFQGDGLRPLAELSTAHQEQRFRPQATSHAAYSMPTAELFDVVITNPPFSITLDGEIQATINDNFELGRQTNPENLFLERWYQLLKVGGRLGAVMPESFFSTAENFDARLFLLAHFHIRAVVSLPAHAFQPWTPTRTSLLFAEKRAPASEIEWQEHFSIALDVAVDAKKVAFSLLKPFVDCAPDDSAEVERLKGETDTAKLNQALQSLGVDELPEITREKATVALELVSEIDPRQPALAAAVGVDSAAGYLAIGVDEIGYRRTKRKEGKKRNDLFVAFAADSSSVQNLNDADPDWSLEWKEGARRNALQLIKEAKIWC